MRLATVVETSKRVQESAARLDKVETLAALLVRTPPDEIETAVAFLSGSLRQGRIGVGSAALAAARPRPADEPSLELAEIDQAFTQIAATRGAGSAALRVETLRELLARATAVEQDFLMRLFFGELRQGAQEGVMMEAVARAAHVPLHAVRRAVMTEGEIAPVARAAMDGGAEALAHSAIRLFQPLRPMLAQPADDADEAMARLGEAALEYKLDGARVQIHRRGEEVRVYSRSLAEITERVPEIVLAIRALPAHELILDGEALALRPDGSPHAFQMSMRRFGRRVNVESLRASLPLSLALFDCLYQDGVPLVDHPYDERTARLTALAPSSILVPRGSAREADDVRSFLASSLLAGHEGIMAKDRSAPYEAGSRGYAWLKLKRVETLDLVVLAAEWGNGRRQGWLSNLHLGARDPETNSFVMLGKTFKGLTDEMLAWQTVKLLALEMARDRHVVHVRPELVVEIAFADVQTSPRYPGGLALRFARVKRHRPGKPAAEADTIERVREIHRRTAG